MFGLFSGAGQNNYERLGGAPTFKAPTGPEILRELYRDVSINRCRGKVPGKFPNCHKLDTVDILQAMLTYRNEIRGRIVNIGDFLEVLDHPDVLASVEKFATKTSSVIKLDIGNPVRNGRDIRFSKFFWRLEEILSPAQEGSAEPRCSISMYDTSQDEVDKSIVWGTEQGNILVADEIAYRSDLAHDVQSHGDGRSATVDYNDPKRCTELIEILDKPKSVKPQFVLALS